MSSTDSHLIVKIALLLGIVMMLWSWPAEAQTAATLPPAAADNGTTHECTACTAEHKHRTCKAIVRNFKEQLPQLQALDYFAQLELAQLLKAKSITYTPTELAITQMEMANLLALSYNGPKSCRLVAHQLRKARKKALTRNTYLLSQVVTNGGSIQHPALALQQQLAAQAKAEVAPPLPAASPPPAAAPPADTSTPTEFVCRADLKLVCVVDKTIGTDPVPANEAKKNGPCDYGKKPICKDPKGKEDASETSDPDKEKFLFHAGVKGLGWTVVEQGDSPSLGLITLGFGYQLFDSFWLEADLNLGFASYTLNEGSAAPFAFLGSVWALGEFVDDFLYAGVGGSVWLIQSPAKDEPLNDAGTSVDALLRLIYKGFYAQLTVGMTIDTEQLGTRGLPISGSFGGKIRW